MNASDLIRKLREALERLEEALRAAGSPAPAPIPVPVRRSPRR